MSTTPEPLSTSAARARPAVSAARCSARGLAGEVGAGLRDQRRGAESRARCRSSFLQALEEGVVLRRVGQRHHRLGDDAGHRDPGLVGARP